MTQILTNPWILVLLATVVLAAAVTIRLVRGDRPANPPGSAYDWRDDQLRWSRLRIG